MRNAWILLVIIHAGLWGQTPEAAKPEAPAQIAAPIQKKAQNLTAKAGKNLTQGAWTASEADWRRAMAIDPAQ